MLNYSYNDKSIQIHLESLNKFDSSSINYDYTKINEDYKDENLMSEKKLEDNMEFSDKYSKYEYNEIFFDLNDKNERDNFSQPTIFKEESLPNKPKNISSVYLCNFINDIDQLISGCDYINKKLNIWLDQIAKMVNLSISSFYSSILVGRNMTQCMLPIIFYKESNSFNCFSNKKRKRSKTKVILPNHNMFNVDKKSNNGRKKKDSGETGKHGKDSKDNLRSKVKTCSLNFLYNYFNKEIQKIYINDLNKSLERRLYQIKTIDNKTKVYNLELLNQTLKIIFSAPISRRADKNENHNKVLIEEIYKINQERNSKKTEKIIKFFDLKYEDFFNYAKNIKDNKNSQEKINGIDDYIKDMVEKFDDYLEEKLSKDTKDEVYNQKLIELIKNFPSDIRNMKEKKNNIS